MRILMINGPNTNMLGLGSKDTPARMTYDEACDLLQEKARELETTLNIVHTNIEGEVVGYILGAQDRYDGIIINPGAYAHYSVVIYDALKAVALPVVEVHLNNVTGVQDFKRNLITAKACQGLICGFGVQGYILALKALRESLHK